MTQPVPDWVVRGLNGATPVFDADEYLAAKAAAAQPQFNATDPRFLPQNAPQLSMGGMRSAVVSEPQMIQSGGLDPDAAYQLAAAYGGESGAPQVNPFPAPPPPTLASQASQMQRNGAIMTPQAQAIIDAERAAAAQAQQPPVQVPGEPIAPPEQQGPDYLAQLAAQYARGSMQVNPAGMGKAAEQYLSRGPSPLLGDVPQEIPNRYLPGVDEPTPEQMGQPIMVKRAPTEEEQQMGDLGAYGKRPRPLLDARGIPVFARQVGKRTVLENADERRNRLAFENAQAREHNIQPSQYEQARTNVQEAENEQLLDRRLQLEQQAGQSDDAARMAYLQGRGFADDLIRNRDEQAQRAALIDAHINDLNNFINQRIALAAQNPAESYRARQSDGDRLTTAIALGLGAAGQALAGGQNVAFEIYMRELDGEVAKQRAMVDTLGLQISAKHSILGLMLSKFKSPEAAEMATRAALGGMQEANLRRQVALADSAEKRATGTAMADAVATQRATDQANAVTAEKTLLHAWHPATVTGQPGGLPGLDRLATQLGLKEGSPERRNFLVKATQEGFGAGSQYLRDVSNKAQLPSNRGEVEAARFKIERLVQIPERFGGGEAQTNATWKSKDIQEGLNAADDLGRNIERVRALVLSGSPLSPTDRQMVHQIGAMAMGSWRVRLGLGVMSESDKELVKPLTGESVNSFFNVAAVDQLRTLDNVQSLINQGVEIAMHQLKADPMATQPFRKSIRQRSAK